MDGGGFLECIEHLMNLFLHSQLEVLIAETTQQQFTEFHLPAGKLLVEGKQKLHKIIWMDAADPIRLFRIHRMLSDQIFCRRDWVPPYAAGAQNVAVPPALDHAVDDIVGLQVQDRSLRVPLFKQQRQIVSVAVQIGRAHV